MRPKTRFFLALLLSTAFLAGCLPSSGAEAAAGVVRAEELDELFDRYVTENTLDPELISASYVYTPTGERWNHLEDQWYYSASLYKVPLMMLFAEKEYNGELTRESEVCGMTLEALEEEVLVNSNNPLAYSSMLYLGQPDVCRRMFCRYSELPEDYYTWDFYGGSYFTARFMTDVMYDLFRDPECFPRVIDCLKRAQPGHFFRLELREQYEIAQKYGSYRDEDGADWNHATGIIYTPHPFILTVMTRYGGISETILGDLAVLFRDYTLLADARLDAIKETNDRDTEHLMPASPDQTGTDQVSGKKKTISGETQTEDRNGEAPLSVSEQSDSAHAGAALQALMQQADQAETEPDPIIGRPLIIGGCLAAELLLILLLLLSARKQRK